MNDHPKKCPLAAVDSRLQDTHQLWHQAEAAYFNPEPFRLHLHRTMDERAPFNRRRERSCSLRTHEA